MCGSTPRPRTRPSPRTLNTQLFQRSPATAGRCCSVPSFTSIARRGGTASRVRNRSRPARTEFASCRRTMSSVSELSVTVLSVSVTSAKRPRPMKASVYSPPAAPGLRARDRARAPRPRCDRARSRRTRSRTAGSPRSSRRSRETPSAAKGRRLRNLRGRRRVGPARRRGPGCRGTRRRRRHQNDLKDELAHARLFWQ